MNPFLKSMQSKKKRPVDPNAPPRPNLLSHDKTIRETNATLEQVRMENQQLRHRIEALESKLITQTQYLQDLHNVVAGHKRT